MPECHRIRRMGKWYGCSTRQYRVATWCETVGRQNRGGGATIKAIVEGATRLQVSYGQETALIYLWQIVEEGR